MAGGWGRQGSGVPLSERVRVGVEPDVRRPEAGPEVGEVCPARHCWVSDAVDGHGVKRPGLLVEWRQVASAWEGRVVYAARARPDAWLLVEEWLPAALLTPL
ncbi:hypothetical protein [Nocardioides sp.]|uniref:hypothetical protein n=1 Tax=Nocardioides sp. TaxID=35761 RepID=UPI002B2726A9|nr:hypothetical protein [Nocardioides sp.]